MKKLKKFFKGDISLGESFWIYLIFVNIIFKLASIVLGQLGQIIYLIIILKSLWEIFAIIGVYRSAEKYIKKNKKRYWGYTAQIVAVAQSFETVTFIGMLFAPYF
jgi:predicted permease